MGAKRKVIVVSQGATGRRPRPKRPAAPKPPALPVVAAISAAGASVGAVVTLAASRLVSVGRFMSWPSAVVEAKTGAAPGGSSGPIAAPSGFAEGASALFGKSQPKPGATRAFLLARHPGPKAHHAVEAATGIPADTVRKVLLTGGSELSGPHVMRAFAVYGPAFARAVLDPIPAWALEPETGGAGG